MWPYDSDWNSPPAPVLDIEFERPSDKIKDKIEAKLDTGASMSTIPNRVIEKLGLMPQSTVEVSGFEGPPEERETYFVNMIIEDLFYDIVEVIKTSRDYALLGRDVLNNFTVVLKGKEKRFDIIKENQNLKEKKKGH
jgi:predicted aspartyl protease